MAVHLSALLIFTGLTGFHSITTVSKVSVKAGGSISIPCLYEPKYTQHVKYLSKGYVWELSYYAVKTNQPSQSKKFSISDDKHQRIFTVTINDLKKEYTNYWCAVEISNGRGDDGKRFQLSVTEGLSQLFVDHQEITAFNGDDVTIHCHHSISGEIQWCRLGGSCVKVPSGSIDGTRVTINANVSKVFTVTMRGLRTESSGWYFCAKGELQMPVHVTVKERPSTRTILTTKATTDQHEKQSSSIHPLSVILPLSLLIFILMGASFTWFMLKRHKKSKARLSAAREADEEVTYTDPKHVRPTLGKVEVKDEDVTYSTLAQQ